MKALISNGLGFNYAASLPNCYAILYLDTRYQLATKVQSIQFPITSNAN
jgi:hypothetical protein